MKYFKINFVFFLFLALILFVCIKHVSAQEESLAFDSGKKTFETTGNNETEAGDYPWIVQIGYGTFDVWCSGTLINQLWVLSAAHCFDDTEASQYTLMLGEHPHDQKKETRQRIDLDRIIIHPNYQPSNYLDNNIALLRLASPVQLTDRVGEIREGNSPAPETMLTVIDSVGTAEGRGVNKNLPDKFGGYTTITLFENWISSIIQTDLKSQVHYWPMSNGERTGGIDIHSPIGVNWNLKDIGDVNGDGTDDIIWQHKNGQVRYWPMSNGGRVGGINIHSPVGADWNLEGAGDVDGDGTDDIIWQHKNGQTHYWPMSNGARVGGINIHSSVGADWNLEGVGDVDGDGTDDIIWRSNGDGTDDIVWQHTDGQTHYWPIERGNRVGGINIHAPIGSNWVLKGVGDLNGDENDDIIWQHINGQTHYWPIKRGNRVGGVDIHTPVGSDWVLKGIGDLNGDENDDIIWQHINGQVHYWPMERGNRVGGIDIHTPVGSDWVLKGVGDLNGDEYDDIIWQHINGQVHYWPMERGNRTGGINIHTPVDSDWVLKGVGNIK